MDLSALSLQKLNREKRERQPNWTESEKQLLLSLTQMHKAVLENKGSDTMTIRQKSEAWDEIGLRMKAAGFNRSKDRLKQQLGRIRAADSKRFKDTMENKLTREQIISLNDSGNHSLIEETIKPLNPLFNENQINHSSNYTTSSLPMSLALQEHHYIKSGETQSIGESNGFQKEIETNARTYTKPNIMNYSIINACQDPKNAENSKNLDNMNLTLQSVPLLVETGKIPDTRAIDNGCISEAKGICAADVTSTIPCFTVSSNIKPSATHFESNQISNSGNDENASCSFSDSNCQRQRIKRRLRNLRSGRLRTSFTKEQGLRQLYMYRAEVERERLRSLRLQQKRDRILYRKDIEIQNLKLQILRNLTNQNRESNSINF